MANIVAAESLKVKTMKTIGMPELCSDGIDCIIRRKNRLNRFESLWRNPYYGNHYPI